MANTLIGGTPKADANQPIQLGGGTLYTAVYEHLPTGKYYRFSWKEANNETGYMKPYENAEPNPMEVVRREIVQENWFPVDHDFKASHLSVTKVLKALNQEFPVETGNHSIVIEDGEPVIFFKDNDQFIKLSMDEESRSDCTLQEIVDEVRKYIEED